MESSVTNSEIPAADGGPLRHDAVITRIKGEIAQAPQQTAANPPSVTNSASMTHIRQKYFLEPGKVELLIALGEAVMRTLHKKDEFTEDYRVSNKFLKEAALKIDAPDRPAGESSVEKS